MSFPTLKACHVARAGDDTPGAVTLSFTIDGSGAVRDADARGPAADDDKTRACMIDAVKALSFPAPERGVVTVAAPLTLASE